MTLWSQSLAQVYRRHPLALLTSGRLAHLAGLAGLIWLALQDRLHMPALIGLAGLWLGLVALTAAFKWGFSRHRTRYALTQTGILSTQGQIEQKLPFGENADYTLPRAPLRRLLNLPAVLHLKGQQNVMRSWTVVWPIADTHIDELRQTLDSVLKGKRS